MIHYVQSDKWEVLRGREWEDCSIRHQIVRHATEKEVQNTLNQGIDERDIIFDLWKSYEIQQLNTVLRNCSALSVAKFWLCVRPFSN